MTQFMSNPFVLHDQNNINILLFFREIDLIVPIYVVLICKNPVQEERYDVKTQIRCHIHFLFERFALYGPYHE